MAGIFACAQTCTLNRPPSALVFPRVSGVSALDTFLNAARQARVYRPERLFRPRWAKVRDDFSSTEVGPHPLDTGASQFYASINGPNDEGLHPVRDRGREDRRQSSA